ncbi:hypothetical protein [Tropicibacter naphthalenivorans]|uniref:Vi polysaccharide biosynthesis protein TviD n=1 Tax=Tropicibacter naphthalenivorans TaxID=441103 RepID=A0A0P1GKZ8_9RHOB|nr:hypothetical protein [Tropicibacter naphthalenivorans]CUH82679.1 Vi polysaccharide biosynthesis protein TviD [Tropicibacter naphthalenivorans]SMD11118.1 hypothetical protein SAMN04488093_1253 [Tropicibacter naphthalenivorans]
MTLSIAPIGSCRIVDPLRQGRDRFDVSMNRGRSFGFTHSSPEAVQQLRFMRGEIDIPKEWWPCVSGFDRAEVRAQEHPMSDLYLVELSSEKILSVGETYLQLNYLRTQFDAFFKDGARKNGYWKAIERGTQQEIDAFLATNWPGEDNAADRAALRQIRQSRATRDMTVRDMRFLAEALPRVVFVTHVNAEEPGKGLIKTRDRYITMVKEVAAAEGLTVFDPTDVMRAAGQSAALEDDLNHYREAFKAQVFAGIYDTVLRDLAAS